MHPLLIRQRRLLAIAATVTLAASLAGCTSSKGHSSSSGSPAVASDPCPNAPGPETVTGSDESIAVVIAKRRNSSPVTEFPVSLCSAIPAIARGHGRIILVRLDGRPVIVGSVSFTSKAKNAPARKQALDGWVRAVENSILGTTAGLPHVDIQQAMSIAADKLHEGSNGRSGHMYVIGSLLQETGTPNFALPGMLDAVPQEVETFLSAQHLIPDLTKISVTFVGATYTAEPQAQLDSARAANLKSIWSAIVRAGKATGLPEFLPPQQSSNTVPDAKKLPAVSLVPVPGPIRWNPRQVYPDSGPLAYKPNKAVLLRPADARSALAQVPAWLADNPRCKLIITGTTARVGPRQGQLDLGRARANTAKSIIVGLGGDDSRIVTIGKGSYFPEYVQDHDPRTGLLIPNKAQQNRTVRFAPSCSTRN